MLSQLELALLVQWDTAQFSPENENLNWEYRECSVLNSQLEHLKMKTLAAKAPFSQNAEIYGLWLQIPACNTWKKKKCE